MISRYSLKILHSLVLSLPNEIDVHTCSNGHEAFEYLTSAGLNQLPDIIITDYEMPGMNGIDFTLEVRNQPDLAELPILMVTSKLEESIREKAVLAGVNDFLRRPLDQFTLQARCSTYIYYSLQVQGAIEKRELLQTNDSEPSDTSLIEQEFLQLLSDMEIFSKEVNDRLRQTVLMLANASGLSSQSSELLSQISLLQNIEVNSDHRQKEDKTMLVSLIREISSHARSQYSEYGSNIPLSARIVSVCTEFEKLFLEQKNDPVVNLKTTLELLKGLSGTVLDPVLVEKFITEKYVVSSIYIV